LHSPAFEAADIAALNAMLPFVVGSSQRQPELVGTLMPSAADALTHRPAQHTIDHFGRSLLTQREREVLFHVLSGYSAALTAERLRTTEGTIKIHRQNIYRKLDIGSQAELFSPFIRCIPFASDDDNANPLETYQQRPVSTRGQR
jgi:DNA-binding CsgD family transcriptional regulator